MQLGLLTDMQFSCPTGMTGSFARGEIVYIKEFMSRLYPAYVFSLPPPPSVVESWDFMRHVTSS